MPSFFGRHHLGAIDGRHWATAVIASAIGPVGYAMAREHLGSYTPAMLVLIAPMLALFISWTLDRPARTPAAATRS